MRSFDDRCETELDRDGRCRAHGHYHARPPVTWLELLAWRVIVSEPAARDQALQRRNDAMARLNRTLRA